MLTDFIAVVALVGTGTVAGILSDSVLAGIPTYRTLPADRYVWIHQIIDRHYEPTMPIIVFGTIVLDTVLAVITGGPLHRGLYLGAIVALLGVAAVSQLAGVKLMQRSVRGVDPDHLPPGWYDPRRAWQKWHAVRTVLVFMAFAASSVAAVSH